MRGRQAKHLCALSIGSSFDGETHPTNFVKTIRFSRWSDHRPSRFPIRETAGGAPRCLGREELDFLFSGRYGRPPMRDVGFGSQSMTGMCFCKFWRAGGGDRQRVAAGRRWHSALRQPERDCLYSAVGVHSGRWTAGVYAPYSGWSEAVNLNAVDQNLRICSM